MKYKKMLFVIVALAIFSGLTILAQMQNNAVPLTLTVKSDKQSYELGEIVPISFELKNTSANDVTINDVFGVGSGSVTVYISRDGKNYPEYNSDWGQVDFAPASTVIKPGQSLSSSATILWHRKPNALQGESARVIKEVSEKTLLTDYAFPEAGTYYVKAVYNQNLQSAPLDITIEEPDGEDLDIWNRIKGRGDIAYFIQKGYVPIASYKSEEKSRFESNVRAIIERYPNSLLSKQLKTSFLKYQEVEIKRQELLQKSQRKQSN